MTITRRATYSSAWELKDFRQTTKDERDAGADNAVQTGVTRAVVTVEVDLEKLLTSLGSRVVRLKSHKVTRCNGAIVIRATEVRKREKV